MLLPERRAATNKLIDALPAASRRRLLDAAEPVELEYKRTLVRKGEALTHVWFPTASFLSLLVPAQRGRLEVAVVGREAFFGVGVALGAARSELDAIVQGPGAALRLAAPDFRALLRDDRALRRQVDGYAYLMLGQVARSAACNRFHVVEQRMARWLLVSADRAQSSMFRVTHAFLAEMLGVRRVGVTTAAHALQGRGLITYARGTVAIRDRAGLQRAACGCYREDVEAYRRSFD